MALALTSGSVIFGSCSIFQRNSKVEKESVLPTDREKLSAGSDNNRFVSKKLTQGEVDGDWAIKKVFGKNAVGETAPFIRFVKNENRIYGDNGCNVINAGYTANTADSTLRFENMASTMRYCSTSGITDTDINKALGDVVRYSWGTRDGNNYLWLRNSRGDVVLELMRQNFDFLNGSWQVVMISGKRCDNPDVELVIDVDEGKLHGNTGCNILNGKFEIDMKRPNSISFSAIATTRMACPPGYNETEFLVALEEATKAVPAGPDKVRLTDNDGETVLELKRINLEQK